MDEGLTESYSTVYNFAYSVINYEILHGRFCPMSKNIATWGVKL